MNKCTDVRVVSVGQKVPPPIKKQARVFVAARTTRYRNSVDFLNLNKK